MANNTEPIKSFLSLAMLLKLSVVVKMINSFRGVRGLSLSLSPIFFDFFPAPTQWVHFLQSLHYVIEFAAGWPAALGGAQRNTNNSPWA